MATAPADIAGISSSGRQTSCPDPVQQRRSRRSASQSAGPGFDARRYRLTEPRGPAGSTAKLQKTHAAAGVTTYVL